MDWDKSLCYYCSIFVWTNLQWEETFYLIGKEFVLFKSHSYVHIHRNEWNENTNPINIIELEPKDYEIAFSELKFDILCGKFKEKCVWISPTNVLIIVSTYPIDI
jgi:hypothetical protein